MTKISTLTVAATNFIGRVFNDRQMDASRSFRAVNAACEKDAGLQRLFQQVPGQRVNLLVYGPEDFTYWYGVLTKQALPKQPGILTYQLPPAKVAETAAAGDLSSFDLPLNYVLPKLLADIRAAGLQLPTNFGDSNTPFIVRQLDLQAKKITSRVYLAAK